MGLWLEVVLALALVAPAAGNDHTAQVGGLPALAPMSGPIEVVVARAPGELIEEMEHAGVDVHHAQRGVGDGRREFHALMTPGAQEFWAERGLEVLDTEDPPTQAEVAQDFSGRAGTPASLAGQNRQGPPDDAGSNGVGRGAPGDGRDPIDIPDGPLNVLRTDVFTNHAGTFVNVEVWSDEPTDTIGFEVVGTVDTLHAFVDAGEYLYHRTNNPVPIDAEPGDEIVITDGGGDTVTATLDERVPGAADGTSSPDGYESAFIEATWTPSSRARRSVRWPRSSRTWPRSSTCPRTRRGTAGRRWPPSARRGATRTSGPRPTSTATTAATTSPSRRSTPARRTRP